MTQEEHFDVASYALGVLDDRDAARFEDHLIGCPRCAYELESFVQVADLLSDVDANAIIAAEESHREGVLLHNLMGEVKLERRKANSRRLYSLAAAVVVFAMLAIGALFAGGKWLGPGQKPSSSTAQSGPGQLDPLPNPGIGGPDIAGQVPYQGTDPRTGVTLAAGLKQKDMGTQINFAVSNITGPRVCQLVIVHSDGTKEPSTSWKVGEVKRAQPLELTAVTATPITQIAHLQVQQIDKNGAGQILVTAP